MIALRDVWFSYPGEPQLFKEFSWSVDRGCSWAVVGSSGSGKTTLLYHLAGLLRPKSGRVEIDDTELTRPRPETGLILQNLGLMPWARVEGNIRLGLRIRSFYGPDGIHAPRGIRLSRSEADAKVDHWLGRMGIQDHRFKFPAQLSGGEQQRVAIARTMVLEPDLLLMDEPFAALDAPTRDSFQDLLLALEQETGHTRILVTHDIEEAVVLGKKILVLAGAGNPAPVVENPKMGTPGYRNTPAFSSLCDEVRHFVSQS